MDTTPAGKDYLLFDLAPARFAVQVGAVREVLRAVALTPVPEAPAIVEGLFDLRGTLVPVLDLRGRFGVAAKPLEPADHFVVAEASRRQVCLRVDRAIGLAHIADADIADAQDLVPGVARIAGIARDAVGIVLIHDLDTFLTGDEAVALAALEHRDQP